MTDQPTSLVLAPLSPLAVILAESLVRDSDGKAELVRDDERQWLAVEERANSIAFAESEGDELRIVPFQGDVAAIGARPYTLRIGPAWLDGANELVVRLTALTDTSQQAEVLDFLRTALLYWVSSAQSSPASPAATSEPISPAIPAFEMPEQEAVEVTIEPDAASHDDPAELADAVALAQVRADVSSQWSWASSSARIPQIWDLQVRLPEAVEGARISVVVKDADVRFGAVVVDLGALNAGTTIVPSIHVPLSARIMSQVEERRGAECVLQLEDAGTGKVLGRLVESIDIQPRDLWLFNGDPRRFEQRERLVSRYNELVALIGQDPNRDGVSEMKSEVQLLGHVARDQEVRDDALAQSLLASFVRPNHPEIALLAREAAEALGATTGDASFHAFQIPDAAGAAAKVDASVAAVYDAICARRIAYSHPPAGWDYRDEGQRIRDHGEVARGGLGTCMDTTVLMAAVIEHVGLVPVLILVPEHIFVGYWRCDPGKSGVDSSPDWYPRSPVVSDILRIRNLVDAGYLGLIETTALTVAGTKSAIDARAEALQNRFSAGVQENSVTLIDVAAARRKGVSPLPAINERPDGVTEIFEYRPDGPTKVTEVEVARATNEPRERQVDNHPVRYRTWKASLFSLNATNDLLNLKSNPRVQPLVLPPEGLGVLEDNLNQDVSFSLVSTEDIPEVLRARGANWASQLQAADLLDDLRDRRIYVERHGSGAKANAIYGRPTFVKEMRSMAHYAKTALDERGMNPLFLCLGLLRWSYKPGAFAEAPLILVPVTIGATRGSQEFRLSLDSSQHTAPNAALIEWLRREHGLTVKGLAEPLTDRAGIDVDAVIAEVRNAVIDRALPMQVVSQARIATLDLSAFRMWQDLTLNAKSFLKQPLVRHLVETPTETFADPAVQTLPGVASAEDLDEALEKLETPVSADSTQKRAVMWAREGRTFVLQGPPGTGKSQTITNIVAECIASGLRVMFVAEKGTALAVVQRRLDAIGLAPFTLNLHHEGSNATEVRAQLKRALTATVTPDPIAMESARRRLRNARFELTQYPQQLHKPNAAGLSAYGAHDELLVLRDGPTIEVPTSLVARQADLVAALKELFQDLQRWTASARVRANHPWRLAGSGNGDPFEVGATTTALRGILTGLAWSSSTQGALRQVLDEIIHPTQLQALAAAANPALPGGGDLAAVLDPAWLTRAPEAVKGCAHAVEAWSARLHGYPPQVLGADLRGIASRLEAANASGLIGRKNRQNAAIVPLVGGSPGLELTPANAGAILTDLVAVQDAAAQVCLSLGGVHGLKQAVPVNPFLGGALAPVWGRLDELVTATARLRDGSDWTRRVHGLAVSGQLTGHADALSAFWASWQQVWANLEMKETDFQAWRNGATLSAATRRHEEEWRRDFEFERLVSLQRWCGLVRKLEPMRAAGLDGARADLLEGRLPAYSAEDALARGVARASLSERTASAGLDRFDAVGHDQRVTSYTKAQEQVRKLWVTDGPARLLARRGAGGLGSRTGGLARELEKTTRRLGTRAILRKHGEAVQELTPLVLCSPTSVVDLIEPGVMDFDVVIFDEASQITVPEAVGALGRARAAIVVGDSKQMPPTRKVGGQRSDDEEIDDPDVEEIVEDQESILSECELARVPTLSLNWHYRSQDEELIAFSNRAYYGGDLTSFPTPTLLSTATGVEFRRVSDGHYLRAGSTKVHVDGVDAGSNTNPNEARAIVHAVRELVRHGDRLPSIGIVTFNEQQRQLIEDLLVASDDARVADVMDESKMGRGEVLFVKALEQVQGDERDTVIFSIGFSKQANGKIPTNFGPLSNSGGERRLNVAVTRARRKNLVFCSFEPSELDVSGSAYDGPKDLKAFLTFVRSGRASHEPGETASRIATRDRHRDDIAAALREAGLFVMSDVGMSNFRIDLVLARPDKPQRPILPILLDGESWMKRRTVSDRDVLPVEVLENLMGWPTVARIWWPMWLQNRDEVISRILAEVDRAEAALDLAEAPVPPPATLVIPVESERPVDPIAVASVAPTTAPPAAQPLPAPDLATPMPAAPMPAPDDVATPRGRTDDVTEFEPANTNVVGLRSVLDALPDRKAAATVREQILDVIETEGPVELTRLIRIVARRFGLNAVRAGRADDITRLIPRTQLRKSRLGAFAWPIGLEPTAWIGFRTADANASRTLDEVAPEEVGNAMLGVIAEYPRFNDEDILRLTAELFGIFRLGSNVRIRLEAVFHGLPSAPVVDPRDLAAKPSLTDLDTRQPARTETASASPLESSPAPVAAVSVPISTRPESPSHLEQPAIAVVAPRDPVIDQIAGEVDGYTPNLKKLDDDVYYDYERGHQLNADLKRLVNEIVVDPDFDGDPDDPVVDRRGSHLSSDDAQAVARSAAAIWNKSVGAELERAARKLVRHLASDPEFDPLPWEEEINNFVAQKLDGKRPLLVSLTQLLLNEHAHESGLIQKVEEELRISARAAYDAMPRLERDIYGFTNRNAKRLQLAAPYLANVPERRRRFVIYWISRLEWEEMGLEREARYATAIRRLLARGEKRASISRTLGISTSVMDRIERENRSDVTLEPDDPILTDLAQAIR